MSFGGVFPTNKGRALHAKAQTGTQLNFTRLAVGDGSLSGQAIAEMNSLVHEVKSIPITKTKVLPGGIASIGGILSNQGLATGFYWREFGLFAQDPDVGEILYCYGNAAALAEYIPAGGGADILEKRINIEAIIGSASNVTANINQSLVYATLDDLNSKVDKVAGKQLTTEDYSTVEKQKLAALSNYSHPTKHPSTMIEMADNQTLEEYKSDVTIQMADKMPLKLPTQSGVANNNFDWEVEPKRVDVYLDEAISNEPLALSTPRRIIFEVASMYPYDSSSFVQRITYISPNYGTYERIRLDGVFGAWSRLWTSNNDGDGSGLDADTVDGLHSAGLARTWVLTKEDMNNNTTFPSGIYTLPDSQNIGVGLPSGWWHVINMHHFDNNGFGAQIATPLSSASDIMYYRMSSGGVWSSWIPVGRPIIKNESTGKYHYLRLDNEGLYTVEV